jgi:PelA/Pel-15E family pectate lyase
MVSNKDKLKLFAVRSFNFNDGAMVRVLEFVREVARDARYAFLAPQTHEACRKAFDLGIACILKCQIVVDGKPTVYLVSEDLVSEAA